MRHLLTQLRLLASCLILGGTVMSCVHEWPDTDGVQRKATLHIIHHHEWNDDHNITVSRSGETHGYNARYHFMLCPADDRSLVIKEFTLYSDDINRADFSTDLNLPPGRYDLWTWADWADKVSGTSLFFDTSDFNTIWYPDPYNGDNELRDALRGMTSFTIEDYGAASDYRVEAELHLERPFARYRFIASDFSEFIDNEISRGEISRVTPAALEPSQSRVSVAGLEKYSVKTIYTGYMPSEFSNFLNRPVNSKADMSYRASITPLNNNEAQLCTDYVMVNGHESSIPVSLEIYDAEGMLIARTNPIDVPTVRNRTTIVRGKFLTSMASGGVGINPDFDGEYNIEII